MSIARYIRSFLIFICVGIALPVSAAKYKAKDVKMSHGLDAYIVAPLRRAQDRAQLKPILVFLHGGGWFAGSIRDVAKLDKFAERMGMILMSLEYRFKPIASFKDQVNDVERGLEWVRSNAHRYSGDASRIVLMGHSAGAHLAGLTVAQGRAGHILGVISNDSRVYDVPKLMKTIGPLPVMYFPVFGAMPQTWRWASPVTYVREGRKLPPFLLMYSGIGFDDRRTLTNAFANELTSRGNEAYVFDGSKYNHFRIHSNSGKPNSDITDVLSEFIGYVLRPPFVQEQVSQLDAQ